MLGEGGRSRGDATSRPAILGVVSSLERAPQVVPPVSVCHPLIAGAAGEHQDTR